MTSIKHFLRLIQTISTQDFFMETEAMSFKMASVRQADCPELRAQVSQLEVDWSQLNSDLTKIQDQLHQVEYWQRLQVPPDE